GEVDRAVARFAQAAGLEDEQRTEPDEHAEAGRREDLTAAAGRITQALSARAQEARGQAEAATQREAAAREHAETATTHRARITRRRELDALAARLADQEPAARDARARLTRDTAARPAATALQHADQARQRHQEQAAARSALAQEYRADHAALVDQLDG